MVVAATVEAVRSLSQDLLEIPKALTYGPRRNGVMLVLK
jgi:hypothetical protein